MSSWYHYAYDEYNRSIDYWHATYRYFQWDVPAAESTDLDACLVTL